VISLMLPVTARAYGRHRGSTNVGSPPWARTSMDRGHSDRRLRCGPDGGSQRDPCRRRLAHRHGDRPTRPR